MKGKHPKGLGVIFATELWERFGFYIMMAVYVLYMDQSLHLSDKTKGILYALFLFSSYGFPVIGGYLADKFLGQVKTVRIGAYAMFIGYILLTLSSPDRLWAFYLGLFLVSSGTGIFKVNMATLIGNLYNESPERKDEGFNIYYMAVNIGATMGPLAATGLGMLFDNYLYSFGAAAAGMFTAIIVFEIWNKNVRWADSKLQKTEEIKHVEEPIEYSKKEYWDRIVTLITLFLIASLFWIPFYQNGFGLTLFAKRSTLVIDWLRPETYAFFNAFFIVSITAPVLAYFAKLRAKGKEPKTPIKIMSGMFIMGFAMLLMALASISGGNSETNSMSPLWLISTYLVITVAEILFSPLGQSYVSQVAPSNLKGFMMGGWFVATALGSATAGIIGMYYDKIDHHYYFIFLAGISFFAGFLAFMFRKKFLKYAK
jgi:POT family proton-dependent oligopeptide transporter